MGKHLILKPFGWPTTFRDCPPGLFVFNGGVCLKSEYGEGESFCESGEVFWGGTSTPNERANLVVQPVIAEWQEEEPTE